MKAPDESVVIAEIVFSNQANHYGTFFGQEELKLMDKTAFIAASRRSRTAVVTASLDKTDFREPVRYGKLVEMVACVVEQRNTSMVVETQLFSEDLLMGSHRLCSISRFVMAAVDHAGRPTPIRIKEGTDQR